jgi:hypothetical protein
MLMTDPHPYRNAPQPSRFIPLYTTTNKVLKAPDLGSG